MARARRKEEEERRSKDEARRKALSGKFKYTTIAGFKAAYRFDYYPVNRYPNGTIPSPDENARKKIWKFKDGEYSIGANIAADFIDGNFTREEMENVALCVIPASSRAKNEVRYRSMCEQVAERLPIINGFSYISITADREDTRTSGKSSDTTAFLAFSSDIQGKDIVRAGGCGTEKERRKERVRSIHWKNCIIAAAPIMRSIRTGKVSYMHFIRIIKI